MVTTGWRIEVHEILGLGTDAHPASYVVNGIIIILIVLNAIVFAAEKVGDLATCYGTWFRAFTVFFVPVITIEYALRVWSAVEISILSRMRPWRAGDFRDPPDHDHRPSGIRPPPGSTFWSGTLSPKRSKRFPWRPGGRCRRSPRWAMATWFP